MRITPWRLLVVYFQMGLLWEADLKEREDMTIKLGELEGVDSVLTK